jgi:hygromycin-B 7''-O-kinase
MAEKTYSQRLGVITNDQFQAALDHFKLGLFVKAEPIPFGIFGQNVFVTSSQGDFVLRGQPHFGGSSLWNNSMWSNCTKERRYPFPGHT